MYYARVVGLVLSVIEARTLGHDRPTPGAILTAGSEERVKHCLPA
jgi:hypothetical protein